MEPHPFSSLFQPVTEEFPAHPAPEVCLEYPPLGLRHHDNAPAEAQNYVFI
jgi:hypothetical protein